MVSATQPKTAWMIWCTLSCALFVLFGAFLSNLWRAWLEDPEFSHGILIPFIVSYLIWTRRERLRNQRIDQPGGLVLVLAGCSLHVLGSLTGTLLFSGAAFALTVMGIVLYLWGPNHLRIVAAPVALLMLMVPLPSYFLGHVSWNLQGLASTISSAILRLFGVPVFQDGNILHLSNYVLEVKQACSGSRSIFALLALALLLGLVGERKWWTRALLVAAAPVLAVGANTVRIVGTGLIARQWGRLAANESLHATWGIVVFVLAVMGLLGFQRFLRWAMNEYA